MSFARAPCSPHPADDITAQGAGRFLDNLSASTDFETIVLQQVGIKGHCSLAIGLRR